MKDLPHRLRQVELCFAEPQSGGRREQPEASDAGAGREEPADSPGRCRAGEGRRAGTLCTLLQPGPVLLCWIQVAELRYQCHELA